MVHRHEFDGAGAQRLQMVDDHRVRDRRVGAADGGRDVGMGGGEALDVCLVDDAVGVAVLRRAVHSPVEIGIDHHRLRHGTGRVGVVAAVRLPEVVAEQRLFPMEMPVNGLRIRVEQQLVGIAARARRGLVRPVHPIAVAPARLGVGQVAVPDEAVDLGQRHPPLGPAGVEETEFHLLCHFGIHGEVRAEPVVVGS